MKRVMSIRKTATGENIPQPKQTKRNKKMSDDKKRAPQVRVEVLGELVGDLPASVAENSKVKEILKVIADVNTPDAWLKVTSAYATGSSATAMARRLCEQPGIDAKTRNKCVYARSLTPDTEAKVKLERQERAEKMKDVANKRLATLAEKTKASVANLPL